MVLTPSARAQAVSESITLAITARAQELRAAGRDIVSLSAGEPDFPTPPDIVHAGVHAIEQGHTRYTATSGMPELRRAACGWLQRQLGLGYRPDEVMVTAGAKGALHMALSTVVEPGDRVLLLSPLWVSYPDLVRLAGGEPVVLPPVPEQGFVHSGAQLAAAARAHRARGLVVNFPNNPSGAVYSEKLIAGLVEFCEKKGIYLIMDDIYQKLIFDGKKAVSCYKYSRDKSDASRLVVINGVSKLYAMTGFRIGWAIANPRLIEIMTNVQAQTTSCPSSLLQMAAVGALNGVQSCVESLKSTLENNRNVMIRELESISDVKVVKPQGTFYCLPDFRAYSKDSVALSKKLLDRALVVTVPGKEFGMEGYLRLSYCGSMKDSIEGAQRIRWALDPHSPKEIYIGDRKCVRDWK